MEKNKITKEYLEELGIHNLREEARTIGVQSPTRLKKEMIISEIMAIVNGEKAPVKPSGRGRPPISSKNPQANKVIVGTEATILDKHQYNNNSNLRQEDSQHTEHRPPAEGGYQPPRTQQPATGGYQPPQRPDQRPAPRPVEGGYPPRHEGGYRPHNPGYQPRHEGGGYQPRHEGGYRPHNPGYQPRHEGGYQQGYQSGYQPRNTGYQPREYDRDQDQREPYRAHQQEYVPREPRPVPVPVERPEGEDLDAPPINNTAPIEKRQGVLEIAPDGFGFLRATNFEIGEHDAYVSPRIIKGMGLRKGDYVVADCKPTVERRPPAVVSVESVNAKPPVDLYRRPHFDNLVPVFPDKRLGLEIKDDRNDMAIRMIDLIAPIGKGQRAMVVSPPKAGKTTLLKKIANSIIANSPEVKMFVLLIDERPEEVTDMQRSIKGEIVYSTFDETPEHHTKAAELLIERAKRLVELGEDVVVIMDSLTRLARANNIVIPTTGKTLSGGIDPGALHSPKRFFGAARNIENGGSLTIIATALIDTGSRMDDVIYEEFKGTGNMEIHLDRKLSEKRIFPAIELNRSGTRREDLLLTPQEMEGIWAVRKMLANGENADSAEKLIEIMTKTKNNADFIQQLLLQIRVLQEKGFNFRK